MGKHAAPSAPRGDRNSRDRTAAPPALRQTMLFGGLAVAVAVIALSWAGAGALTALAVGAGLVALGGLLFLLLRRTGLLATESPSDEPTATTSSTPHP